MTSLPEEIKKEWKNRKGPAILTTVSGNKIPNSIYVGAVGMYNDKIVIADNYFDKTLANIKDGSEGAILFMTKEGKAYQIKGSIEYHESGPFFDDMKKWNPDKHPGNAAVALCTKEIYSGAKKLF